jgi:hypothetical protein
MDDNSVLENYRTYTATPHIAVHFGVADMDRNSDALILAVSETQQNNNSNNNKVAYETIIS